MEIKQIYSALEWFFTPFYAASFHLMELLSKKKLSKIKNVQ